MQASKKYKFFLNLINLKILFLKDFNFLSLKASNDVKIYYLY